LFASGGERLIKLRQDSDGLVARGNEANGQELHDRDEVAGPAHGDIGASSEHDGQNRKHGGRAIEVAIEEVEAKGAELFPGGLQAASLGKEEAERTEVNDGEESLIGHGFDDPNREQEAKCEAQPSPTGAWGSGRSNREWGNRGGRIKGVGLEERIGWRGWGRSESREMVPEGIEQKELEVCRGQQQQERSADPLLDVFGQFGIESIPLQNPTGEEPKQRDGDQPDCQSHQWSKKGREEREHGRTREGRAKRPQRVAGDCSGRSPGVGREKAGLSERFVEVRIRGGGEAGTSRKRGGPAGTTYKVADLQSRRGAIGEEGWPKRELAEVRVGKPVGGD